MKMTSKIAFSAYRTLLVERRVGHPACNNILRDGALVVVARPEFTLEMGKNSKFWDRVRFRFFDDKGSVLFVF